MSKSSSTSKTAPMVIPSTRPRNPFGVGSGMAKAGSHVKPEKVQRRDANKAVRDVAHKVVSGYGSDDFSP